MRGYVIAAVLGCTVLTPVAAFAQDSEIIMRRPLPMQFEPFDPETIPPGECGHAAPDGFSSQDECVESPDTPIVSPWSASWVAGEWQGDAVCGEESIQTRTVTCMQYGYEDPDTNSNWGLYPTTPDACEGQTKPATTYVGDKMGPGCEPEIVIDGPPSVNPTATQANWANNGQGPYETLTCSQNLLERAAASCIINGEDVDAEYCAELSNSVPEWNEIIADGGALFLQRNAENLSGCQVQWHHRYEGNNMPMGGACRDAQGAGGTNYVDYYYYPAYCFQVGPYGIYEVEFPHDFDGDGEPESRWDPSYDPDFFCESAGLPNPGPLRTVETQMVCDKYVGADEASDSVGRSAGDDAMCAGSQIGGVLQIPYGTSWFPTIEQHCASLGAGCCQVLPDPDENAQDSHQRMFQVTAHRTNALTDRAGYDWSSAYSVSVNYGASNPPWTGTQPYGEAQTRGD
tara:strand:- start:6652 stop:8022 length:1371 start_codon:yes stop_codon:yes gene_type:complete